MQLTVGIKNALLTGVIFGVLIGLLYLITGWFPLLGAILNYAIVAISFAAAFIGAFAWRFWTSARA